MATLAQQIAAEQAKAIREMVQGALPTDAQGNPVPVPQVAQLVDELAAAKATIQQQQIALNGKASQESLNAQSQRVTSLTTTVGQKADTTVMEQRFQAVSGIDVGQADAITQLGQMLATGFADDEGKLQTLLAGQTTINSLISGLRTDVELKAPSTTVSNLSGLLTTTRNTLNDPTTGLAATNTLAATQKGRVDTLLTTTVPALQADTATRLLRAGDTSTGPQMQPTATLGGAAPRLDQTYGGLNAPIRFVTAVGATAVAMLPGPLTDPTPQGRKAKPYSVILTMRTAPTVGATVTVGTTPGGSEVFSKTFLLTGLPVVNNILAPTPPVFIELPPGTTLYAKATAGTWDVEVLSYYKS